MSSLKQFEKQQYLVIESFRKNGQGVKTPVWFAQDGETLYVWTEATSGKAKRIRREGNVNIAPSTGSGEVLGEWVKAVATADASPTALAQVQGLMVKKYGLAYRAFALLGKLRKSEYTTLKIQVNP
ncbi:MAG: PPOX class F420-dependent oxidoreductase [Chloroflexi bacterium]|nr:MAG: PPOX class F420-dependent oxidoreductase [Chloroflexota bacterium]